MANYQSGVDALNALTQEDTGSNGAEFAKFSSGTSYTVKVLGTTDLISFFSYGIFKKVNSFVAKNPSKKSPKGYPIGDLTPWDKAWKYHKDLSEDFSDFHGQEASKYRAKQRFAMAFLDLETGKPIIVDVSKAQGQAIYNTIKKYEKKLGKIAFELSKSGQGTATTVNLAPIVDMEEDLTSEQQKNFKAAPEQFEANLFEGLLFEIEEDEQVKLLVQAGFDVSLIGMAAPASDNPQPIEISDDDLPF